VVRYQGPWYPTLLHKIRLEYELPQGCEFAMRTGASHLPWTIALPSPVCSGSLLSGSSMQVPSQRALSVTQRALSVTQEALSVTQRALSVTQRALSVTQEALSVTQRSSPSS
jgi:hypothetical protein